MRMTSPGYAVPPNALASSSLQYPRIGAPGTTMLEPSLPGGVPLMYRIGNAAPTYAPQLLAPAVAATQVVAGRPLVPASTHAVSPAPAVPRGLPAHSLLMSSSGAHSGKMADAGETLEEYTLDDKNEALSDASNLTPLIQRAPSTTLMNHAYHGMLDEEEKNARMKWLLTAPRWFPKECVVQKSVIDSAEGVIVKQLQVWGSSVLDKNETDAEDYCVGPALKLAWRAHTIVWLCCASFPWLAYHFISCEEVSGGGSLALYPKWLWIPFLMIVAYLLYLEVKAARYSIVSQVLVGGVPKLGGKTVPYSTWTIVMILISLVCHMDIFTNGVFMARVMVTDKCSEGNDKTIEKIWQTTLAHSKTLSQISSLREITFANLCLFAWMTLFLQFLYSVAYAWPQSPELQNRKEGEHKRSKSDLDNDKEVFQKDVHYDLREVEQDCAVYEVLARPDQQHGRALQVVAESARMNYINWLDPVYMEAQALSWRPTDVVREMQRTNFRFFIFLVESFMPPNLQASYMCFEKALSQGTVRDVMTFFSVMLTIVTGLMYVHSELTVVINLYRIAKRQKSKFDSSKKIKSRRAVWNATSAMFKSKSSLFLCFAFAFVGTMSLAYCAAKVVMGFFVCEQGMWNLDFPLSHGCVKF